MTFETNIPFKEKEHPNGYSSLKKFYDTLGNSGVLIKSNYECRFENFFSHEELVNSLTFYCQSINIPGLKTTNTELFYKGRSIQIPTFVEQEHDFQLTILNDASGYIYSAMRGFETSQYIFDNKKHTNVQPCIKINVISDELNHGGMIVELYDITINNVSGLELSHSDSSLQTFTVNGYSMFTRVFTTVKK